MARKKARVKTEAIVECSFLIPLCRDQDLSDGKPQAKESWRWLNGELFLRFQGRMVAPGTYQGAYEDPDTREMVIDESRVYCCNSGNPAR